MAVLFRLACLAVCLLAIGCSGNTKEIAPSAEGAPKEVPDEAKKGMEESFKRMPPAMQEKMKGQMEKSSGS